MDSISNITGTHIAYLHLCHRKLWLFAHGIHMEHTSDLVGEGKLIEETSYQQRAEKWKEIEIEGIKIDHYDPQLGIIREVKKSNKREYAHIAQAKYYLYVLRKNMIHAHHAVLEYPRLRERDEVWLEEGEENIIQEWEKEARNIIKRDTCPPIPDNHSLCRRCAYFEFCFAGEEERSGT